MLDPPMSQLDPPVSHEPDSDPGVDRSRLGAKAERLSRLAIESSPSGVLVVGPDGVIVLANREIERQFGYTRQRVHWRVPHVGTRQSSHVTHSRTVSV
jgi:PAS domain-containing protein